MSIRPILFNYDMVQAIIDGRKTETRRIIKAKGERYEGESVYDWCVRWGHKPKYNIGDYLYVRETFMLKGKYNIVFKADYSEKELEFLKKSHVSWTPSIHMPKDRARLWLEVTDVDAQELQAITEEEIFKEGIYKTENDTFTYKRKFTSKDEWYSPINCFYYGCWEDTLNFKDPHFKEYAVEGNPYVWVYRFRVLPIEELLE